MPVVDDLFQLIRSLTPSEKRYFKIHAKTHVAGKYKSNYEKLFDAMNYWPDEEEYDEKLFKRRHKGKSFLKNLSSEKNYLYDLILETLRAFHSEGTIETLLFHLTADLRLLYDKGLHHQGKKQIEKIYKMAEANEHLPLMITLCQFKDRFTRFRALPLEVESGDHNFEREKELLQMLEAERSVAHIRREIFNLYITGKLKPVIQVFKERIEQWIAETKAVKVTLASKRYLLVSRALIAEKENDYSAALQCYSELIEISSNRMGNGIEPDEYMRTLLGNYLVCAHHCERYDLFFDIIHRIEQQPALSQRDKAEIFIHSYQYKLLYHLNVLSATGGEKLVQEIERGLSSYKALISPKIEINLRMNICVLFLQQRKYALLVAAIGNAFILLGRDKKYASQTRDLKFMELMASASLRSFDLLHYQLHNLDRWLHQNSLQNTYTNSLLVFFRECINNDGHKRKSGQLAVADCPPEMLMLKELVTRWYSGD